MLIQDLCFLERNLVAPVMGGLDVDIQVDLKTNIVLDTNIDVNKGTASYKAFVDVAGGGAGAYSVDGKVKVLVNTGVKANAAVAKRSR
jgi:hypothetical protein